MRKYFTLLIAFIFLNLAHAQITLIKDFDAATGDLNPASGDRFYDSVNSRALFKRTASGNSNPQSELWSTDGTTNGTEKILSIPYELQEDYPAFYEFTPVSQNKIAFVAAYKDTLYEIYTTDGTMANTQKVASSKTYIYGLESIASGLFFTTDGASSQYSDLNKIDLSDKSITNVYSFSHSFLSGVNKINETTLVILAQDSSDSKVKVFKSDGTKAGTQPLAVASTNGSILSQQTVMTKVGSKVFFFYKEPGTDCCNFLWVTDGTAAGTKNLKEFNMVSFVDYIATGRALAYNNKFYFLGVDNSLSVNNDRVLWVSDGTTAGTIALHSSADFTNPSMLTVFNNEVYFIAFSQTNYDYGLYQTNGTTAGTQAVSVTYNGSVIGDIGGPASVGGRLYFSGITSSAIDYLLYSIDANGTAATVYDDNTGAGLKPSNLYNLNDNLLFFAKTPDGNVSLYKLVNSPTSVTASRAQIQLTLFPNPARETMYIRTSEIVTSVTVQTVEGKVLKHADSPVVDLSDLNNGLYLVHVELASGISYVDRLMVSK